MRMRKVSRQRTIRGRRGMPRSRKKLVKMNKIIAVKVSPELEKLYQEFRRIAESCRKNNFEITTLVEVH